MRNFAKAAGIPATTGLTTTTAKDGKLTATIEVDGKPFIVSPQMLEQNFNELLAVI